MTSPYLERPIRNLLEAAIDGTLNGELNRSILFQFLDGMGVATLITDANGAPLGPRILFANKAFCTMCGYDQTRLQGASPRILHGPLTDHDTGVAFRRDLETNGSAEVELINYDSAGGPYRVRIIAGKFRLGTRMDEDLRIGFSVRLE